MLGRSAALASAGATQVSIAWSVCRIHRISSLEGQLRDHEAVRVSDGDQIETYHLVSIQSGLPQFAMQSAENTGAAVKVKRIKLWLIGRWLGLTREEMEKGPPYDPVPEIAPHLPEIEEHFLRWLEQLDDAMRDPTDLKVSSADFPPSANWILNSDQPFFFHALWDQMEEMSLDGFVPRDHLERKDPEVLEVANAVQNSLSRRSIFTWASREDPTPGIGRATKDRDATSAKKENISCDLMNVRRPGCLSTESKTKIISEGPLKRCVCVRGSTGLRS